MRNYEYEYDYHHLAEDADYIDDFDTDECYYDDGTDEPWADTNISEIDNNENEWEDYYNDIAED